MADLATAANGTAALGGGDPAAPMDAQPSTTMTAAGDDGASKELVEMLKKQLAEKQNQVASLRVFQDHYQAEQRSFLTKTQEAAIAYTKELDDGASTNNKQYTESLRAWSANLHTHPAETLEQQMPLGILIDCASADKKRAREAESVATETADALKASNEKCDGLEVEKEKYRKLYTEMQALANERQQQAEELAMRNAQITGAAKRHDFTFQTSREVRPPARHARRLLAECTQALRLRALRTEEARRPAQVIRAAQALLARSHEYQALGCEGCVLTIGESGFEMAADGTLRVQWNGV
jgi:hypothetical protein